MKKDKMFSGWFKLIFGPKIFCISFQRTGTTSTGNFFKEHGYRVAGYHANRSLRWSNQLFLGNYPAIFNSMSFRFNQVFEDNPWFVGDFYRYLFYKFPNSKFILFTRDADKWFDSMMKHSKGKTLGNTYRHSRVYRREVEFDCKYPDYHWCENLNKIDNLLDLGEEHRDHYKNIYKTRNKEIIEFFKYHDNKNRFIHVELEDPDKWKKLGYFFNIKVKDNYVSHKNKS